MLRYFISCLITWTSEVTLWIRWISSIYIAHFMIWFGAYFQNSLSSFHFIYVLFTIDYSVSTPNRRFLRRFPQNIHQYFVVSEEKSLSLSSYRIAQQDVFLFRSLSFSSIVSSTYSIFSTVSTIFGNFLLVLQEQARASPPPGKILNSLLATFAILTSIGVHIYFMYRIICQRHLLPSPQATVCQATVPPHKQVHTIVASYSTEQFSSKPNLFFDLQSSTAIVDNSANTHIWSNKNDFVNGSLKPYANTNDKVMTVGSESLSPSGIGKVQVQWLDDDNQRFSIVLNDVLYFPNSPVNVISCTSLAHQLDDNDGTWIQTKRHHSIFEWDFGSRRRTIHHPSSNLPELDLLNDSSLLQVLISWFPRQCYRLQRFRSPKLILPEVRKDDIAYLDETPADLDPPQSKIHNPKSTTFDIGERVVYSKDDHCETGTLTSISIDADKIAPIFHVSFGGLRSVSTTKEFISHIDDVDPMELPITKEQLLKFTSVLSQQDLNSLLRATCIKANPLRDEFMQHHFNFNHLPFPHMFQLCRNGYLPKKFLKLKTSDLICPSCILGKQKRRPWRHKGSKGTIRSTNEKNPGDRVSIDQMISHQPGLVPRYDGKHTRDRITCVTCFKDHISGLSYSYLQVSSDGATTLEAKHAFESYNADFDIKVKAYHADNGRFAEKLFRDDVSNCDQDITFCAVGSHHQNGIIERHIGLLTSGTRTTLLHAQRNWPDAISSLLWPFAWLETEFRYNHLALDSSGRSPFHRHTGSDIRPDLSTLHPLGCPAYVLDARAQIGQSIPKWDPKSRLGIYVGRSKNHAGNVALILNPRTLHVSPQFHVVFDDNFATIKYLQSNEVPPMWKDLVTNSSESSTDEFYDAATMYNHSNDMLTDEDKTHSQIKKSVRFKDDNDHKFDSLKSNYEGVRLSNSEGDSSQTISFSKLADLDELTLRRSPRIKELKKRLEKEKSSTKKSFFACFSSPFTSTPISLSERLSFSLMKAAFFFEVTNKNFDGTLNAIPHYVFASKNAANDTFTLTKMFKEHDRADFVKAMQKEIDDHESRGHWSVVDRSQIPPKMKTILAIWSFKRKRKPDGTIIKHKARLCAHGGMQQWGINFWETYAPVVNWLSVRTLLILSLVLDLETRSIDFVLAFPQADLDIDVYMEIPFGFTIDGSRRKVLKLEKNLYGLKQAAYNWYEFLKQGLERRNFRQSETDNCVFYRNDCIVLTYVDDCVIFSKSKKVADDLILSLEQGNENFDFTDDGDLLTYLGISLTKENKTLTLVQPHLIQRILSALDLTSSNPKDTPVVKPLLHKDLDGLPRKTSWNYRQIIGMLNYLQNSTRPDLSMAVHQCARFSISPFLSHERAVHRIGKYLLGTAEFGLIFSPEISKGLEVFVDADFAGGWTKADADSADNVLSRTGFVIRLFGAPVLWTSRLQTEIALSTAEAEYIALSTAMRAVIPLMNMLNELQGVFGIKALIPVVSCRVFEDNESAISMSTCKKFTPRTKHIALKYHHFRKFVTTGQIKILSIDTKEQMADILTKPVESKQFRYLRKKLCGW